MDGIKSLLSSSQSGSIIGQTNSLRNIINDKESLDGIKSILSSSHSGSLTRDLICPSNSLRHIINMNENAAFSQVFQPLGFNLGDEASWTNKSRISSEQSRLRTSKATVAGASTLYVFCQWLRTPVFWKAVQLTHYVVAVCQFISPRFAVQECLKSLIRRRR